MQRRNCINVFERQLLKQQLLGDRDRFIECSFFVLLWDRLTLGFCMIDAAGGFWSTQNKQLMTCMTYTCVAPRWKL